jgi:hypothetical protein
MGVEKGLRDGWWMFNGGEIGRSRGGPFSASHALPLQAPSFQDPLLLPSQVVSKLGLLDTSRTAWESDGHDVVWKGLKTEFELEQRFENLVKKVGLTPEPPWAPGDDTRPLFPLLNNPQLARPSFF